MFLALSRRQALHALGATALVTLGRALPAWAHAQSITCRALSQSDLLTRLSGERILALRIVTRPPDVLPGPSAVLNALHVRTRAATIRRELLVGRGQPVDALTLAESLRRLRQLRYLADVELTAEVCTVAQAGRTRPRIDPAAGNVSESGVRLTVTTRDAWSTVPSLSVRAADSLVVGSGATLRTSFSAYRAARRGVWSARIAGEQLINPDSDVRALATTDPTLRAIPARSRLAEAALAANVERSVHLHQLTHTLMLDGAVFGATSVRWDPAAPDIDVVAAGILGLGLRVAPMRLGRSTVRLDVGFPVIRSAAVRRRPYVGISVTPWIESGRQRDGAHMR